MAWYEEWFGAEYLELYSHRDGREAEEHVDFVVGLMGSSTPRRILDLACGAGRHSEALARRGMLADGVDLSLTLLARSAVERRCAGDMRQLPFAEESFDWVLNFFTSFGYFEKERENFRVLEEIARVLVPGGRFLIDLFNLDQMLAGLEPRDLIERDGQRVEIERWYDVRSQRINKRIRMHSPDRPLRTFVESVRAYREEEVVCGLRWAGLEVDRTYGNFQGERFDRESPRLILVGHRPV